MTIGELRNKIAGANPNIPVILYWEEQYYGLEARWQNHVKADLSRDVTIPEAMAGEGIMCLVLTPPVQTAHPNGEGGPTPRFRAKES